MMNVENCNTAFFSLHTEITILREGWRSVLFRKKNSSLLLGGAHITVTPHFSSLSLKPSSSSFPSSSGVLLAFSSPFFSVNLDGGVDFPETEIQI